MLTHEAWFMLAPTRFLGDAHDASTALHSRHAIYAIIPLVTRNKGKGKWCCWMLFFFPCVFLWCQRFWIRPVSPSRFTMEMICELSQDETPWSRPIPVRLEIWALLPIQYWSVCGSSGSECRRHEQFKRNNYSLPWTLAFSCFGARGQCTRGLRLSDPVISPRQLRIIAVPKNPARVSLRQWGSSFLGSRIGGQMEQTKQAHLQPKEFTYLNFMAARSFLNNVFHSLIISPSSP